MATGMFDKIIIVLSTCVDMIGYVEIIFLLSVIIYENNKILIYF